MRRLTSILMMAVLCVIWSTPVDAGLFGPSKKELLHKLVEGQQQTNATLHRIEVEQARQTEILRHMAERNGKLSDALTEKAAQWPFGQPAGAYGFPNAAGPYGRVQPGDISTPAGVPTIQPGFIQTPAGTPTVPQGAIQTPAGTPTIQPGGISTPPLPSIQGSSRRDSSFASRKRPAQGPQNVARPVQRVTWTNLALRR